MKIKLSGAGLHFILKRAVVVHEKADDLKSQPSRTEIAFVFEGTSLMIGPM